jgi:hypothetical protein
MATKLRNVSILTAGEAKGHNLLIDETTLVQALQVAQTMGRIKVTNGHGAQQVMDILGFVDNFHIEGDRLLGDLTLLSSEKANYVASLAAAMPDQFGLSLTFSGVPEESATQRYARVTEIYDISVVATPAANASLFSAFSRLPVDSVFNANMAKAISTPEVKQEELSETASALEIKTETPAVTVTEAPKAELAEVPAEETKAAEPTIADLVAMIGSLNAKLDTLIDLQKQDIAGEQSEEVAESSEMAAKPETEKTEFTQKVERDAAGAAPVPAQTTDAKLSRAEILNQFNEEQDPLKRTTLLRKLGL